MTRVISTLCVFWGAVLVMCWLAGCTPTIVRCELAPNAEQLRWMTDVTQRSNEHEVRLNELERTQRERDGGCGR